MHNGALRKKEGEKQKEKREKQEGIFPQELGLGDEGGLMWVATAGSDTSTDQENGKVTESMYEECHSLVHSATSIECLIAT